MAIRDIKITVGLIMRDPLFLDCLATTLNSSESTETTIKASTADKFLAQLSKAKLRPSVCIVDFSLPNAYKLIREMKANWSRMKVLVLVSAYTDYTIDVLIQQRVNGFVSRKVTVKQLIDAVTTVKKNKFYYSAIAKQPRFEAIRNREVSVPTLTVRQVSFLNHCASAAKYSEIAEKLGISVRGVDTIRDTLFAKFGVNSRTDLVMEAIRAGIVSIN